MVGELVCEFVFFGIDLFFHCFFGWIFNPSCVNTHIKSVVKEAFAESYPECLLEGVNIVTEESHQYVVSVAYQPADGIVEPPPFLLYLVSKQDGNAVELLPDSAHSVYFPLGRK